MNFDSLIVKGSELNLNDIKSFEKWRGYKLPNDFVEFTLKYPFAHMSAEFDAEGRPDSMISNMLRFSKDGYSSIYVDEAYDINDFGPYVLFGEDPGGNYIAFDYSNDELNPSVVFIDHEKLGLIQLPESKTVEKLSEIEYIKLQNSNRIIDYPGSIHYVSESFTDFLKILKILKNNKVRYSKYTFNEDEYYEILKTNYVNSNSKIYSFLKKYGGSKISGKTNIEINNVKFNLKVILNFNYRDSLDYRNIISNKGGISKYVGLFPFILVKMEDEIYGYSAITLKQIGNQISLYLIPNDEFEKDEMIIDENLIFLSDDIDEFIEKLLDKIYL
ncbi:SMI1/KNR4 family protein [Macrococcus capreoli]|uniref:SMI1/KNR4 family protein n=1 Tax=Macrococcus capreoli TaxID=2982690 RepID=UPI0021D599B5|nr:SMI1/KNR4 family protein [Macrococcus sp. TMW 2.2395]MCU7557214.1 SMI1/KNR4 family protein [Macrococcus sp. TMW 2.2395]